MTEIMPFPENNYETVLLDRPFGGAFFACYQALDPKQVLFPNNADQVKQACQQGQIGRDL